MANTVISLRSSGVASNTPSLGILANGELSLNFADGIIYYKTAANALGSIRTTQASGLNKEIQFNDSGSFGANAALTFDKANTTLTSNNIVANTITAGAGGYVQFSDGSKQYSANAGGGGGTDFGFGVIYTSNNSVYVNATTANDTLSFVGESGTVVFANSITKTIIPVLTAVGDGGNDVFSTSVIEADGEFIHRDHWLEDDDKSSGKKIMPCVSRFDGKTLVLDR